MTCPSIPDPVRRVHLKTALATVTTAAIASLGMASLARADPVPFDPSRYAGRIVYLDFWASWCPPCLQSFPWMAQITERYAARGLAVVAVNLDRDRGAADRFLSRAAPTFEIVFDPKGDVAKAYQLNAMPSSFLLDRESRIVHRHVGFRVADQLELESRIRGLLENRS